MSHHKTVLIIGANGYIGNATALAFSRSGHKTYGLVRKPSFLSQLAADEITALLGSPSDLSFLPALNSQGVVFDVVVSTTENLTDYISHYNDILSLLREVAKTSNTAGVRPLVMFTSGCKDYGPSPYVSGDANLAPHTEESALNPPWFLEHRCEHALKIFEHGEIDGYDATVLRPTNVYGYGSSFFCWVLSHG
jgi:nucleoside-diphosphate-sugar epimerase